MSGILKLRLHDAIYRLRFYSNALIHILSLSNSHNNVASTQHNRGDKSHCVVAALQFLPFLYSVHAENTDIRFLYHLLGHVPNHLLINHLSKERELHQVK